MQINRKLLMAKGRGFTISIDKMTEGERQRNPNGDYGRDYNNLLFEAKRLYHDIAEIFPPEVVIATEKSGLEYVEQRYNEIDSYCEQIYQLVAECEER